MIRGLEINMRAPELKLLVQAGGCLIDTMQALSGATLGNKRLTIGEIEDSAEAVTFLFKERSFRFETKPYSHLTPGQVAAMSEEQLFTLKA
jgi:formylmethanofuran dehydrogenase subunit E